MRRLLDQRLSAHLRWQRAILLHSRSAARTVRTRVRRFTTRKRGCHTEVVDELTMEPNPLRYPVKLAHDRTALGRILYARKRRNFP
jgi:hypothetical protein